MIIPEYKNYTIDIFGEIKNVKTGYARVHVLDKQTGYYKVILWKNNKYKSFNIHFLLALCFLQKVDGKNQVNHKDGVKTNNSLQNLEWCTVRENIIHSVNVLGKRVGHDSINYKGALHTEYGVFCTVKEAADMAGVSKSCMINWLNGLFFNKSKFIWSR